MPAYHSVFLDEPNQQVLGNLSALPLRTRTRGPAQTLPPLQSPDTPLTIPSDHPSYDIVDEILAIFRANTFFRNFEIHGPADRTMIYGILFVSQLLTTLSEKGAAGGMGGVGGGKGVGLNRREGEKLMMGIALDGNFAMPGDPGFPLGQAFEKPSDRGQADVMRGYIGQLRQEVTIRLVDRLWEQGREGEGPSKWWMGFVKRRFMGKSL